MDLKVALQKHFAKSDGTNLEDHINSLFHQLSIFIKLYPSVLNNIEIESLKLAIKYHDYGKLNKLFQCKLPVESNEKPVKCSTKIKDDIVPHQFLSPLFFIEEYKNILNDNQLLTVIYSIINHHVRGQEKYLKNGSYGIKVLLNLIEENFNEFFSHLSTTKISDETKKVYKKYLEEVVDEIYNLEKLNKRIENDEDFVKSIIKVSGLLIKIDHSASGYNLVVEEEPIKDGRDTIFLNYLKQQNKGNGFRPFQEKYKNKGNLVLVADTGLGKTGLAFLWSKRKMFYVLPNRTSTNAMYETFKSIVGEDKVGLLHSSSLFYIYENYQNKQDEDYTIFKDYENTRNLSKPITVSTADQLFTAVFKYPTYEKIYSTLSYSDVVVDEIQGFEPSQIVPMLKQIEETTKLGARYLIITATLPDIVKTEFERMGFEVITDDEDTLDKVRRHKVKIVYDDILSYTDFIIQKAKEGKKVLVIVNTVSSSQDIYKHLKNEYVEVNLLHSRFIYKDRVKKENKIKEDCKGNKGLIWVTTQLVEASLDIDFDILFTQVAPADSLIQRMGRIWRHKQNDYIGEHNIYIFTKVDEKKDVYEKAIRDFSVEMIKNHLKEEYLLSTEKRKLVQLVYSRENLIKINSQYFRNWEKVEKVLKSNWDYLFKKEAHKVFRDTITFEAVPYKFKDEIEKLLQSYKNTKDIQNNDERRMKRISLLKRINDYKVPIPVYWVINEKVKGKSPYEVLDKDLDLFLLAKYFEYDEELGVYINPDSLKSYNFEEDIFI